MKSTPSPWAVPEHRFSGSPGYLFFFPIPFGPICCWPSPSADEAQLWEALSQAALEKEVRAFPQGLDTVVGEKGVLLSGGQKQRLALARAFLIQPPILILDNTLASVDLTTERTIQRSLCRPERKGLITIIISHRLVGLEGVDEHLSSGGGQDHRVRDATRQLIRAKGPLYARLYPRQRWKWN